MSNPIADCGDDDDEWNPVEQTGAEDDVAVHNKASDEQEPQLDEEAIAELEKALEYAEQQKAKGTSLFQEGRYEEACRAYREGAEAVEKCVTAEAMNSEIRRLLVALYCNAAQASLKSSDTDSQTNGACTMAERALSLDPSNVKALFRRGCAYANASDWDMAWDDLNRAITLDPGNEAVMRELEKVGARCGKQVVVPEIAATAKPEGSLEKALVIASKQKEHGTSLFKSGELYAAFESFRSGADALESFSLHALSQAARKLKADLYNNAALALLQCKHIEGASKLACEMACKVLEIDPQNVKALFRRGCGYCNCEDYLKACSDFEQVLLLDPNNKDARRELTKIENLLPYLRQTAKSDFGAEAATKGTASSECCPTALDAPEDRAEVCKAVLRRIEQLREDIIEAAREKSCHELWCQRLNKIQTQSLEWARHQLSDAEMHADLVLVYGPFFADLDALQKEDFVMGHEFEKELQTLYSKELEELFQPLVSTSDDA